MDKKEDVLLTVNTNGPPVPTRFPKEGFQGLDQYQRWTTAGLPILTYCLASIIMTVVNKYVVSGDFNMVFLLLTVQSVVTVLFLIGFKAFNLIKFRELRLQEAKAWSPVVAFLICMIYTGSKALQFLPIPIYTIFKNLTIILIAYGEVVLFSSNVTLPMLVSFLLMTLSSVVAGWNDASMAISYLFESYRSDSDDSVVTTMAGYAWMAANCFSSAAFVLFMRKRIKLTNFEDFDTVFYNNLLSIPVLLVASLLLEDWSSRNLMVNFPPGFSRTRIGAMVFSGAAAFCMSYASAWCVRTTSSTTYSMVGSLNKLPIAISGIIFFGDPATWTNVTAILIGFVAGMLYTVAKSSASRQPPTSSPSAYKDRSDLDNQYEKKTDC